MLTTLRRSRFASAINSYRNTWRFYPPKAKRTSHRSRKPKGNMPRFDLQPELKRICGADLTSIDGMDVVTALTILSEIGTTVSQWTDEQHFVSWAGLTPNRDISGGKVIRQR